MRRIAFILLTAACLYSCSPRVRQAVPVSEVPATTSNWLARPEGFEDRYNLDGMVILSRHNIRSPLSGGGSVLSRITPHEWYSWTSAPGELSLRGGVLETQMGQFFRKWLVSEGLVKENEIPVPGTVRFYSNSMQRTIATAQYFSSGMFPVANVEVEHHCKVGTMDPVFNPQLTKVDDEFRRKAIAEIAAMGGDRGLVGAGEKMAGNFAVLERILDIKDSPASANDTTFFRTDDLAIILEVFKEPAMTGGLKMANSASDALILQYYEETDDKAAGFGHSVSREEWESMAAVKDWYGDVLFTAPSVAVNVAHPLLETMLSEMRTQGRKFSFLCGHDSNIASVLAALQAEEYDLPNSIEKKTPIGSKLMIGKWKGRDGKVYADLHLVYSTPEQLRSMPILGQGNPPCSYPVKLKGLKQNIDGLYLLTDLERRFTEAIAAY